MKKLLFTGGLLFGACESFAQSVPATTAEAVMDTAVFEAFGRSIVAADSARQARPALPCLYAPEGHPPACIGGHRDRIIPIVYGLSADPRRAKQVKRGEVWPGGCFVTDCDPHYYCTLHCKKL